MQTFLPYPSFSDTARILDRARLGKQRVEAYQIIKVLTGESKGWSKHPIVLMWSGHIPALATYGMCMCREWTRRGYQDNLMPEFLRHISGEKHVIVNRPSWCWDKEVHISHQSNLVRKFPEHYRRYFPNVPNDLPYKWVTK